MQKLQILLLIVFLGACSVPAPAVLPTVTSMPPPTKTPTVTFTATPELTPVATAMPNPLAGLPETEVGYLDAQKMIQEGGKPEEWSWRYAEDGTLQLVRDSDRQYVYVWDEESGSWQQVKGKDYDYAIIEGSETRVELDGYPVSIVLGKSVSRYMGDLEFGDPTVFANLMWEVEYQAWLGHKPGAEGKTLAEFKQLVRQAKAGDQAALEAITYQTWLNDMDDQAGYKPLPVTVRPLLGGGWTTDGVLQPDEIQVVIVDTERMQNISPQDTLGGGYGFSYMLDPSGRVMVVYYVGGVSDYLGNRPNAEEGYLANRLTVLPEKAGNNKGQKKIPVGNRLTSIQEDWERVLMGAMELKK